MSTIVKNIHILKDGVWRPISKVFHQGEWKKMKGIFYDGVWYEIGSTCVVMPEGCAIATNEHPRFDYYSNSVYGTNNLQLGLQAGGVLLSYSSFGLLGKESCYLSTTKSVDNTTLYSILLRYDYNTFTESQIGVEYGFYVRCVKDYTGTEVTGTILYADYQDGDGNYYYSVVIGAQAWTIQNLHTTKYQDGSNIPLLNTSALWNTGNVGYTYYNHDYLTYGQYYGFLYRGTIEPSNLVSNNSYRVPSETDWSNLKNYLLTTNWCNGVSVTGTNVMQFLKSCRQVNHPLADMHLHVETEEFIQEVIIYKNDVQVKTIGSSSTSALPIELGDIIKLQILTSRDYITIQDVTARISYGGIVNPGVRTFNMFEAPYHIIIR